MACYRLSGQDFYFPFPIPELEPFELPGVEQTAAARPSVPPALTLCCRTAGRVGAEQREVECWSAPPGLLLKVAGGSDFYIAPGGQSIVRVESESDPARRGDLTRLDREILLSPALALALAMRGTWCLHASAVVRRGCGMVFLGESSRGKSTLAAYLCAAAPSDWLLAADDILPVAVGAAGVEARPRFPQLKLPAAAQPGYSLPECLPLGRVCVLARADCQAMPELQPLSPRLAAQALVRHTAGTRLFGPELLGEHLAFCARIAEQVPVHRLIYPHRKDVLPKVKELLESVC